MTSKIFNTSLFKKYSEALQAELDLLKNFEIESFKTWDVDWEVSLEISKLKIRRKPWGKIPVFEKLLKHKKKPAVYYFTVNPKDAELIFTRLQQHKTESSIIRKTGDIRKEGYFNISHVPNRFKGGVCLYVGSIKQGLNGRLLQHLGFGSKGRTGALYLYNLLKLEKPIPKITFHYVLLDEKYRNLTKHIECVIQDTLKPFIGKRALENLNSE